MQEFWLLHQMQLETFPHSSFPNFEQEEQVSLAKKHFSSTSQYLQPLTAHKVKK